MVYSEEKTPVTLFIFNRIECANKVFEAIRAYRPTKFFLISDGARADKPGEWEIVEKVRKLSEKVDWDCDFYTNFADYNMGCDSRVVSGLNWVFSYVDRTIVLEDDCLPSEQFFAFCEKMLEQYKENKDIAFVSGAINIKGFRCPYDYFFSRLGGLWGWGTWKDRWQLFEYGTETFEEKKENYMKGVFSEKVRLKRLNSFNMKFDVGIYPWDYVWTICTDGMLRIMPRVNLVENIGFSSESTHTFMKPFGYYGKIGKISNEFTHPDVISHNQKHIEWYERKNTYHIWNRVIGKIKFIICKSKS